jgi:hypothetical protein
MTCIRIFSYHSDFVNESSRLAIKATVERGAALYERARHLPALVRFVPGLAAPESPASGSPEHCGQAQSRQVLRALAQALRAQRKLGRTGHWTYDLNRHLALRQAFMAEARALRAMLRDGRAEN